MKDDIKNQKYIQSQYSNSPTIKNLLNGIKDNIDPTEGINLIYNKIINLDTAEGVGLDYWGAIVGVNRKLATTTTDDIFILDDSNFLNFIKFKAVANISDASMATLNKMSKILYNDDSLIITNVLTPNSLKNGDYYNSTPMRVKWIWRANEVSDLEQALFSNGIILCLAAGVGWTIGVISKDPLFGFYGSDLNPFNQGAFGVIGSLNNI